MPATLHGDVNTAYGGMARHSTHTYGGSTVDIRLTSAARLQLEHVSDKSSLALALYVQQLHVVGSEALSWFNHSVRLLETNQ